MNTNLKLSWLDGEYIFKLQKIEVDIYSRILTVIFNTYVNGEVTNKTYHLTRSGKNFDVFMNYNTIRGYYVMLCEDLGIDPSVVPEDMSL